MIMDYSVKNAILLLEEKNKIFGEIYIITNIKNNKQYVGQAQ